MLAGLALSPADYEVYEQVRRGERERPPNIDFVRIDNQSEIESKAGKEPAGNLLKSIVKLVQSTLRAEDSMGRMAAAQFSVMLPSTKPTSTSQTVPQMKPSTPCSAR